MSTGLQFDERLNRSLEAVYQTKDAARRRTAVRDALQIQSGERVLDIGAGPGFLADEMAEAVGPNGQVHCIDMSEPMLNMAQNRCAGKPWVVFQHGSATDLPVGDATFDAAISVQVNEFIADVETALSEMYRVLRPGGRAVAVSTDWDAIAWHASDRARMNRVLGAFAEHCVHTALPRTLAPKLRQAGFMLMDQRVIPQFNTTYNADAFSYQMVHIVGSFVPGRRGVTEEEAGAWVEDLRQTGERGEYFFSLNQYLYLVAKPE
ncbi:MAG TPA: methyltransferase domain-containing protein [Bryobacteraceae bacterium]|nr:methyltransferase domain-containing protein [Bryobacteraceae bacterium]